MSGPGEPNADHGKHARPMALVVPEPDVFPPMRQRLLIAVAVAIGAGSWMAVAPMLQAIDGASGLSLATARVGMGQAVALVYVAAIPTIAAGLVVAAAGHRLSGVFAVAGALTIIATSAGSIDGWFRRDPVSMPEPYVGLIVELAIWMVIVLATLVLTEKLAPRLRPRLPALMVSAADAPSQDGPRTRIQSCGAAVLCAAVAGALALVMIRSTDAGQVTWALIVAFFVGALVSQSVIPQCHPWAIVLSPALVGVAAYLWVLFGFGSHEMFLTSWYAMGRSATAIPGPAMALPVFYASAAVVGVTAGLGCAESLNPAARVPSQDGAA